MGSEKKPVDLGALLVQELQDIFEKLVTLSQLYHFDYKLTLLPKRDEEVR